MAHSIELLPDPETDAVLRADWDRLAAAGLRSVRRPASPTDRPHCTLLAAARISSDVDALLPELATHLPLAAHLGPPVALPGRGGYTLAVAVVSNAALLALHAQAAAALDAYDTQAFAHTRPGRWTAHITAARRLTGEQVGAALDLLNHSNRPVAFTAIRRWDGDAARDVVVEATDSQWSEPRKDS